VLYELRQRLRTEVPNTHDWASIVAYAVSPWDFDEQIRRFRDGRVRKRLEVYFDRMDFLVDRRNEHGVRLLNSAVQTELDSLVDQIRTEHQTWLAQTEADRNVRPDEHAEALGMKGASEKRIGIIYAVIAREKTKGEEKRTYEEKALSAYKASQAAYKQSVRIQSTDRWHWVMTQFLSISAILAHKDVDLAQLKHECHWWHTAHQIAEWQLDTTRGQERAWALGTLAELELLGSIYLGKHFDKKKAQENIARYCSEIIDAVGPEDFAVNSTRRQLQRYAEVWQRDCWEELAKVGMDALKSS
jgi:hypothetical protein